MRQQFIYSALENYKLIGLSVPDILYLIAGIILDSCTEKKTHDYAKLDRSKKGVSGGGFFNT